MAVGKNINTEGTKDTLRPRRKRTQSMKITDSVCSVLCSRKKVSASFASVSPLYFYTSVEIRHFSILLFYGNYFLMIGSMWRPKCFIKY